MLHTPHATRTIPAVGLVESLIRRAAHLLAQLQERRRLARARKVVRSLSDAQLADAGIDRDAVLPPQPTIEVEARLMARLMEMR
jgi:uncharacterized protein YjiS (DUF1127 family)